MSLLAGPLTKRSKKQVEKAEHFEIQSTQKGNVKFSCNGFFYYMDTVKGRTTYLKCCKRGKVKCKARAMFYKDTNELYLVTSVEHTCQYFDHLT